MRKPGTFSKCVHKKGKGTQGEICRGDLCTMQDSHKHPSNVSFLQQQQSSLCFLSLLL